LKGSLITQVTYLINSLNENIQLTHLKRRYSRMGEHTPHGPIKFLGIIVLLVSFTFAIGSNEWARAGSNPNSSVASAAYNYSQEETWVASEIKGQVNRPLIIHLTLSPYPPPAGAFYTAIVDVLDSPQGAKPEIVPGVPDISVRCPKPGIYRLRVQANLIEKSSCALAAARILKEQEIRLIITP
jgi:hypothetical protein